MYSYNYYYTNPYQNTVTQNVEIPVRLSPYYQQYSSASIPNPQNCFSSQTVPQYPSYFVPFSAAVYPQNPAFHYTAPEQRHFSSNFLQQVPYASQVPQVPHLPQQITQIPQQTTQVPLLNAQVTQTSKLQPLPSLNSLQESIKNAPNEPSSESLQELTKIAPTVSSPDSLVIISDQETDSSHIAEKETKTKTKRGRRGRKHSKKSFFEELIKEGYEITKKFEIKEEESKPAEIEKSSNWLELKESFRKELPLMKRKIQQGNAVLKCPIKGCCARKTTVFLIEQHFNQHLSWLTSFVRGEVPELDPETRERSFSIPTFIEKALSFNEWKEKLLESTGASSTTTGRPLPSIHNMMKENLLPFTQLLRLLR